MNEYINVYGVTKQIQSDKGGAFISKEYIEFCKTQNINRIYGTANLHTGTGLVERTIQSLKNLVLANLEDDQNLRESVNRALHVLRFTIHSETKKTPFESHFGRTPRTKLSNLRNSISVDSKDLSVYITRNSAGQITDHLVMSKKKTTEPKYKRGMTFSQTKKPTSAQTTTTLTRRINTRQNNKDQPTCSKTLDNTNNGGTPCIYSRKEAPKTTITHERSDD